MHLRPGPLRATWVPQGRSSFGQWQKEREREREREREEERGQKTTHPWDDKSHHAVLATRLAQNCRYRPLLTLSLLACVPITTAKGPGSALAAASIPTAKGRARGTPGPQAHHYEQAGPQSSFIVVSSSTARLSNHTRKMMTYERQV